MTYYREVNRLWLVQCRRAWRVRSGVSVLKGNNQLETAMRFNGVPCATISLNAAFFLTACSPNAPTTNVVTPTSAGTIDSTPADTALGKATFSALIDGEPVSGGPIDDMQQQNAAYMVPGEGGVQILLFYLSDMKSGEDGSTRVTHSFRLTLPKSLGAASGAQMGLSMNLDASHAARYSTQNATVTISSITASRIIGTFSGTMNLSSDTPNVPKRTVTITDGKFDIPIATSKIIPS